MELKFKIIETESYTLAVSNEELKEGDLYVGEGFSNLNPFKWTASQLKQHPNYIAPKIIAYQPKGNAPELDLPLLSEIVVEDDIEKLINKQLEDFKHDLRESNSTYIKQNCEGAIFGLNRLKESYKAATKVYSEGDLRKAFNFGTNEGYTYRDLESIDEEPEELSEEDWDSFVKTLKQPRTPKWFVAEIENKVKSNGVKELMKDEFYQKFPEELPNCVFEDVLKTTTINGKEYLVGTYLYE